jgi:hypothetical protein
MLLVSVILVVLELNQMQIKSFAYHVLKITIQMVMDYVSYVQLDYTPLLQVRENVKVALVVVNILVVPVYYVIVVNTLTEVLV